MINIDREFNQKAKIRVIGVGGGGNNTVDRMIAENIEGIDFIAVNTDSQVLLKSMASTRIQLGKDGLGAGGRPEVGRMCAEESRDEVTQAIEGADMVFVTAGMGGGTGTGAAPIIAGIARNLGILTVGVVTKPFDYEGRVRMRHALGGIAELQKNVDALIVIPNQKLYSCMSKDTSMKEAFQKVDEVLIQGVSGISELITKTGEVNLDFADLRTVLIDKGIAHMGIGYAKGSNRAIEAIKAAVESPLLESSIKGAQYLLICFAGGPGEITMNDVTVAMEYIESDLDMDAEVIYGSTVNDDDEGGLSITLIATGFDTKSQLRVNSAAEQQAPPAGGNLRPYDTRPNVSPNDKRDIKPLPPRNIPDVNDVYKPNDDEPIDIPGFLLSKKRDPYK